MSILRACLDWRVIAGLAVVGIAVFLVNPGLLATAFPLLLVAACPLSMLLMMRTMASQKDAMQSPPSDTPAERLERVRAQLAAAQREQQRLAREVAAIDASGVPAASSIPETVTSRQG